MENGELKLSDENAENRGSFGGVRTFQIRGRTLGGRGTARLGSSHVGESVFNSAPKAIGLPRGHPRTSLPLQENLFPYARSKSVYRALTLLTSKTGLTLV